MNNLSIIVEFLDYFLKIHDITDGCFNGLQVEGNEKIKKVAFAVDGGIDSFDEAAALGANMLIVHHGHFWEGDNPSLTSWKKLRIKLLLDNRISLYAAHLPLDRHPEIGNNAQLLKILGSEAIEEFLFHEGKNIGWIGNLKDPTDLERIIQILNEKLNTKCKVLAFGKKEIETIAVCSGGGGYRGFSEAVEKEVDLFLTGDQVEIYSTAKDAGMNVIFAGHHATETVGLKALQKIVEEKLKVETVFIDIPTGL